MAYACTEFDEFGQCLNWLEIIISMPVLTIPDALILSSAIGALWAQAWVWSRIRRAP